VTPYILLGRRKLPPEKEASPEHVYDESRQIWLHKSSGTPLVSWLRAQAQPSQFGETLMTETREGVDQQERASFRASEFGETILTATREGVDQTEGKYPHASEFGETTLTKTTEGVDQSEGRAFQKLDGPYSHF
jgi:hypothetical protein